MVTIYTFYNSRVFSNVIKVYLYANMGFMLGGGDILLSANTYNIALKGDVQM